MFQYIQWYDDYEINIIIISSIMLANVIINQTKVWAIITAHFTENWGFYTLLTRWQEYVGSFKGYNNEIDDHQQTSSPACRCSCATCWSTTSTPLESLRPSPTSSWPLSFRFGFCEDTNTSQNTERNTREQPQDTTIIFNTFSSFITNPHFFLLQKILFCLSLISKVIVVAILITITWLLSAQNLFRISHFCK